TGHDTVWRESPDGSRVLTGYLAFGYWHGASFENATRPGNLADAVRGSVERQRTFMTGDRILVMVGYDHAGPDASLPIRVAEAATALDEIDVLIAGLDEHLAAQRMTVEPPTWRGELRSSARAHL